MKTEVHTPPPSARDYVVHIDYARNRAVVYGRGGTTFFSWGRGRSRIRDIVTSRYDPDGGEAIDRETHRAHRDDDPWRAT